MSATAISPASLKKIKEWAKKYGQSEETLLEDFNTIMKDQNARFPTKPKKGKETQARMILYDRVKSNAINLQAVFFGAASRRDIWSRRKQQALEVFRDNEVTAINEGLTDEEGIPLDIREEMTTRAGKVIPNPRFGSRLPISYARSAGALIRPLHEDGPGEWKPAAFNFRGKQSANPPPSDAPVQTRGVLTEDTENRYVFSSDKTTAFQYVEIEHISDADSPPIHALEIIEEKFPWIISTCEDLEDWMSKYAVIKDEDTEEETPDYNSFVIIKGWALNISYYDNDDGTKRASILLVDEPDEKATIVRASINAEIIGDEETLDFGEGSYIWAIGSPYMREKYEDGQTIDDEYVPWLNAFGVHAVPEYRMDPDESVFQEAEEEVEEEFEE